MERSQRDHGETTERPRPKLCQGEQGDQSQTKVISGDENGEPTERPKRDQRETKPISNRENSFGLSHPVCGFTMLKHTRGGVGPRVYEHCMDPLVSDGASGKQILEGRLDSDGGAAEDKAPPFAICCWVHA